jgi:peptide/nickel transport system permease protein
VSGFKGGWVDALFMRTAEVQMTFPFTVLALIVMSLFDPSVGTLILVFTVAGWPLFAKVTRGLTLSIRERSFVEATISLGASTPHILFQHILPNILPHILVLVTLQLPVIIFAEAGLSFLGVGIAPPEPSWGVMLGEGKDYLSSAWWLTTFPGVAMMITVISLNFIGD